MMAALNDVDGTLVVPPTLSTMIPLVEPVRRVRRPERIGDGCWRPRGTGHVERHQTAAVGAGQSLAGFVADAEKDPVEPGGVVVKRGNRGACIAAAAGEVQGAAESAPRAPALIAIR